MDRRGDAKVKAIFDRILKDIKPSPAEVQQTVYKVNHLMGILKETVPRDVELRVVGSVARGTNLKGDGDIDIFMLFDKRMDRDTVVKKGVQYGKRVVGKEKGRYEVKYAEHPYIRLYLDSIGIKADIVPALKIDNIEDMGTTVDRTPMHTDFINGNLSERQRDDVRLLKYFMKAHGIYGAEIKTNGFSGYLCELLIHHYGSLHSLMEHASRFRLPVAIEPLSRKESPDGLLEKFNSEFVVVDPVDAGRNVAAGVSMESLGRFAIASRRFLDNPEVDAFYGPKFSSGSAGKMIRKLACDAGLDVFAIMCKVPDKSEDIVYPQLRKVNQQIVRHLEGNGFTVYESVQFILGRMGFMIILAPAGQHIGSRMLKGPEVFMSDAVSSFMRMHKDAYGFRISGTCLYALEKSRFATIRDALGSLPKECVRHKDINLAAAKITVNRIPAQAQVQAYLEITKRLTV